jgi:hypothetical protein
MKKDDDDPPAWTIIIISAIALTITALLIYKFGLLR